MDWWTPFHSIFKHTFFPSPFPCFCLILFVVSPGFVLLCHSLCLTVSVHTKHPIFILLKLNHFHFYICVWWDNYWHTHMRICKWSQPQQSVTVFILPSFSFSLFYCWNPVNQPTAPTHTAVDRLSDKRFASEHVRGRWAKADEREFKGIFGSSCNFREWRNF